MQSMEYKSNNNVIWSCNYHVVFCTKYRRDVLDTDVSKRFKELVNQLASEFCFEVVEMEVMPDHVHLLISVDPQFGIHRVVKQIKGRTSRILREEFRPCRTRIPTLWTNSYFVSTVGGASLEAIKAYIEAQPGDMSHSKKRKQ